MHRRLQQTPSFSQAALQEAPAARIAADSGLPLRTK
jgi:hypothetical protein